MLRELAMQIHASDTEQSIAERAVSALAKQGITETWYHASPALVLLGSRSCVSASGREYRPSAQEPVGETNLVTVDLSPSWAGHWGDCARSFAVEEGRVTSAPRDTAFAAGIAFLQHLQLAMRAFVTRRTTFHELASWTAQEIGSGGFVNLDFRGNVGHSLAARRSDRLFIEAGNHRALSEANFFTFEPHVRASDGVWGFKHEDVFFFNEAGKLEEL